MSQSADLSELPSLPMDEDGPVFAEPWQAQAFAMTLELHRAGHFTWKEWAAHLSEEIGAAQARGDPDRGDTYYLHWLAALEKLVAEKGLTSAAELDTRKTEWDEAARHTPHGEPIELGKG
ncbi:MAG: nitrile hydratase accessory protein [Gammaproteobacteria bacterium]|nr:nitrile hydratase accessory protein [Gammaproteobacteria bacterium]NIM73013.1 nitrile hydratase accessory protein [Gammaproteobacteria bacterium]NIN38629.1 nitrile hydratase accessory protein [Gammaproteobacteria bacterium]NIO24765.1 nitrile hydratase accessory protein [Gammaproteobacteria bacterium]NIO65368.1 nitrile hydratase accessory protein [Gammaproteobacteria bacterium]